MVSCHGQSRHERWYNKRYKQIHSTAAVQLHAETVAAHDSARQQNQLVPEIM